MAQLSARQRQRLSELGREPIDLPAEIFFAGNEQRQRTPGPHHLPQYQKTGTYNHPNLVKMRLRVALDRLERAKSMQMSETEKGKVGVGGMDGDPLIQKLEEQVVVAQDALVEALGSTFKKELESLNFVEKKPAAKAEPEPEPTATTGYSQVIPDAEVAKIPTVEPTQGPEVVLTVSTPETEEPVVIPVAPVKKKTGMPKGGWPKKGAVKAVDPVEKYLGKEKVSDDLSSN